ncbi:PAP2 family protein [Burkholderia lata]|uniref:PAP2 family protein n=2 Tax=Burkholderia lata (strain ATCC 17760 / DSM 23089 / LMG 22485 / NCIMB 9086 / R18194 / 383) TaxID=482957 RepID=A0A6P2JIM9_BURL3|nr:PAP2 family protein [Burkholderia lata]
MKSINPLEVQGLVSMPSFHTMMAMFLVYSMRNIRLVLPAVIVLNVIMIASTITVGGHYLADVLAGIVCGAVVILVVRLGLQGQFAKITHAGRASGAPPPEGSSVSAR